MIGLGVERPDRQLSCYRRGGTRSGFEGKIGQWAYWFLACLNRQIEGSGFCVSENSYPQLRQRSPLSKLMYWHFGHLIVARDRRPLRQRLRPGRLQQLALNGGSQLIRLGTHGITGPTASMRSALRGDGRARTVPGRARSPRPMRQDWQRLLVHERLFGSGDSCSNGNSSPRTQQTDRHGRCGEAQDGAGSDPSKP